MSNDYMAIRARILALVPVEQLPFAEFELRMLIATMESENLRCIHQQWRPIADERDELRAKLEASPVEPLESRRASRNKHEALQARYDELLKKYMDLEDLLTTPKSPNESGDDGQ